MILHPFKDKSPPEAPKPEKHIHEYSRSRTNKKIYRCVHPECTHYNQKEFLEGKKARCRKCHQPFILDKTQLKNKDPRCLKCSASKAGAQTRKITEVLEVLLAQEP